MVVLSSAGVRNILNTNHRGKSKRMKEETKLAYNGG